MSNFTFNDFQNIAKEGNHYVSTFKDRTFKLNFKAKLKIIDVTANKVILQLYEDKNGETIDDGRKFTINRNNYKAFRDVFSMYKPLEFKTAFPVKFYKVMTKTKAAGIEFYDSPQKGKKIKDDQIKVAAMTYFCYGHYKSGGDDYVLLSTRNYLAKTGNLSDLLGWVKIKDNDERISAVLWNTNLGLRPDIGSGNRLSPIVFEQTEEGYNSARIYFETGSLNDVKNILINDTGLQLLNELFKVNGGKGFRWIPINGGLENESIMEVVINRGRGYAEEGLIVAKDENGNLLLDVDVIVEERKLHELNSVILDFTSTAIESEARTMVKKIISIFFNQDFFDIDDEFLEGTTLEDLWIMIVGDRKVADYLMPTLFTTNFTFKELLDNIEDYMPQLIENSNVISGLISQNYIEDNKNSVLVEVNFETHEAELLYWVNNEHLKLFKGIIID